MIFVTKKIYNFFDGIEILIDAVLIGIFCDILWSSVFVNRGIYTILGLIHASHHNGYCCLVVKEKKR